MSSAKINLADDAFNIRNMIQTIIHATDSNNLYMFDIQSRLSMLIHPELRKAHENLENVDPYYLRKYEYLKKYGFFVDKNAPEFEVVTESMVRESLIETTQLVFEVTDSCNLNCTYCGYGDFYEVFDKRSHKKLNIHKAKKLIKYIYELKVKNNRSELMIGFYGGEPLLNVSFIKKIIDYLNKLNSDQLINISYSMTTNATLIHRYIDFLVDHNFEVLISLDGNEINNSYRIFNKSEKDTFSVVVGNVDMIQRIYPIYFENNISFNAVLHDRNSVKDVYEFIYKRYNKIPEISELLLYGIKPEKQNVFRKMFHNVLNSEAEFLLDESNKIPNAHYASLLFEEFKTFFKQYSINSRLSNIPTLYDLDDKYFPADTCLPFSLKVFLTVQNRLLPCERINHKYYLGVVDQDVVIDVNEIANRYNMYYNYLKNVCMHCYAYKYCGLCMFRIVNLDRLDSEIFACKHFYSQKKFEEKLSRIYSFFERYPEDYFYVLSNM